MPIHTFAGRPISLTLDHDGHVSLVGRKDLSDEIYRLVRFWIGGCDPETGCRPAVNWRRALVAARYSGGGL